MQSNPAALQKHLRKSPKHRYLQVLWTKRSQQSQRLGHSAQDESTCRLCRSAQNSKRVSPITLAQELEGKLRICRRSEAPMRMPVETLQGLRTSAVPRPKTQKPHRL